RKMAKMAGFPLRSFRPERHEKPHLAEKIYLAAHAVFQGLGFDEVSSLDVSAFEGADYIHDLNDGDLPPELHAAFDTVIDHGTMEHVFHIPNVLKNIFQLLREGGRIIHSSPSNNVMDHGFYQFSPVLFSSYYSENDWEINGHTVFQMSKQQETEPPFFCDYEPGLFDNLNYGGLDAKIYGTVFIATKTSGSTFGRVPQQPCYSISSKV
ncbi:MAG: class I SAM-dependent methyltransferase, partial [Bdellovibrionales bacterium]